MTPEARTLVLRLSVPPVGEFRAVATDLAIKVAEFLGQQPSDAKSAGAIIEGLAAEVVSPDNDKGNVNADITFEFHQTGDELHIEARCGGRASEARRPLPT
jgi:hypothetical protein